MTFQGRVTEMTSGSGFPDGVPRVTVKLEGGTTPLFDRFQIPNRTGLTLDDIVIVTVNRAVGLSSEAAA